MVVIGCKGKQFATVSRVLVPRVLSSRSLEREREKKKGPRLGNFFYTGRHVTSVFQRFPEDPGNEDGTVVDEM